ncbi:MAG TPA: bifunctional diaminohydroxyphosphoribosylaminopyrimidine deaminase/5-amino-6-(5-phosphoribosylamino)uracil reductase RibD [Solirubrobacterales bacterium]|nr:bifunctional diaminohydroxyphosphoribosylaminopyrimidine deaminase/5-amino-6-(5-phosphoribosylamino)uracil reductase RibD [Solirubrobacterales bacterium]
MTDQSTTPGDSEFLRRALALAEGGRGRVSPNPLVGAVVVRDGKVIGEGFHAELGGLHAERAALADAARRGEDPAGATLYVTLEPCAHQGRQPPCVEAIVEADIGRVCIASGDPSAKASGRGPDQLRAAGIEVKLIDPDDEVARAARLLNQSFRKHGIGGLPLVIWKTAMSLDGRTATAAGASPWISGERSRELVHVWRGECDAIAVGIGTALADDPLLTARMGGEARRPVRVVFDSAARLPLDSQLVATTGEAPLTVVHGPDADRRRLEALLAAGVETVAAAGETPAARVEAALAELGRRGLTSLLLEGGATLVGAFAAAGQIDEARVFVAPLVLGGPAPALPPTRLEGDATRAETVGEDTLIRTRFKEW